MKGGFPIHCHNTVHEDHQMMMLFNVATWVTTTQAVNDRITVLTDRHVFINWGRVGWKV